LKFNGSPHAQVPSTEIFWTFLMPKAYAVVTYRSISDPEKLAAYAKLALPASR
jgi:hypothetical protein